MIISSRKVIVALSPCLVGIVAAALVGAASSSGADGGIAAATAVVASSSKPDTSFVAPGPSFDATKVKGKTIYLIAPLSIPFVQEELAGIKEAVAVAGATLVALDGNVVDAYVRGVQQAIAQKADVILIESFPVSLFSTQIAQAQAAGIKVISVENHDPGLPPSTDPKGVVGSVDQCHACAGREMADYAIADSDGKADAIVFWSSDVPGIGKPQVDAIQSEFAKNCPSCSVKVVDAPLAQWSTGLTQLTSSTLTADPQASYLLPLYDGMVSFMQPAVKLANRTEKVKIVTFNATAAVMNLMKSGNLVAADVGVNNARLGWAIADQAFRAIAGAAPVADPKVPTLLFTKQNIGTIDLTAASDTWYGDSSLWRNGYKKLWGLL